MEIELLKLEGMDFLDDLKSCQPEVGVGGEGLVGVDFDEEGDEVREERTEVSVQGVLR
jgi:hypothetical protein